MKAYWKSRKPLLPFFLGSMLLLFGATGSTLFAQQIQGILPQSFQGNFPELRNDVLEESLPRLRLKQLRKEDAQRPSTRFAAPLSVDLDPLNAGQWTELSNGDRVWRLKVKGKGGMGMALLFDDFFLPSGSMLHLYQPDGRQILGAYTSFNNPENNKFLIGFIEGETAILEYYEPKEVKGKGRLHIFRVDEIYERETLELAKAEFSIFGGSSVEDLGFGASFDCHQNIACTMGQAFEKEKRAVARIILVVEEGTGYCTGSLINNTARNGTPYLLSAYHCQDSYTPLYDFWRFDFGYEGASCQNPSSEPGFQSILGCTQRAGYRNTDFLLLELASAVPAAYEGYFMGWDRNPSNRSNNATIIHHPRGDIKKIARREDPVEVFANSIMWNNEVMTPPNHHYRVIYSEGTFEIGSSGSALIDNNRRIIGQLHGGSSNCGFTTGYFGRFSTSWEGGGTPQTRLRDWLDPLGTGQVQLNGMENPVQGGGRIAGMVNTEFGQPLLRAEVRLSGSNGLELSTHTDETGQYVFSNVPYGSMYQISVERSDPNVLNGITTLDLIRVQKHILSVDLLDSPYQIIAADVNATQSVTTIDLIQMQKLILGLNASFAEVDDWYFIPAFFEFEDLFNPFRSMPQSNGFTLQSFTGDLLDIDFIGIKMGDVNGSAETQN